MAKRTYPNEQKSKLTEIVEKEDRILYKYAFNSTYYLNYTERLNFKKTVQDSIVIFEYESSIDNLKWTNIRYNKKTKHLTVLGIDFQILVPNKYLNENISKLSFDLYDYSKPTDNGNAAFLFNREYGILNIDPSNKGYQVFFMPSFDYKEIIDKDLLRK